jgi:DNA-directed RNA polymerase I and III subunit RPAC2
MHVRIQTNGMYNLLRRCRVMDGWMFANVHSLDTTTALEALEKGFNDLMDLCDVVTEKFTTARDQFNAESGNRMEA